MGRVIYFNSAACFGAHRPEVSGIWWARRRIRMAPLRYLRTSISNHLLKML